MHQKLGHHYVALRKTRGWDLDPLLEFNLALLAKFVWWILTNKDCLRVQVLRANIKLGEIGFGKIHQKAAHGLGKALKQQKYYCWEVLVR